MASGENGMTAAVPSEHSTARIGREVEEMSIG